MIINSVSTHSVIVEKLLSRYPVLKGVERDIYCAYEAMREAYSSDHKLLVAGNGGSASDSEHIVGELMKVFAIPRPISNDLASRLRDIDQVRGNELAKKLEQGLPAMSLVTHEALFTACINDIDGDGVFAQQLLGYGRAGDVFLGISTSGNSTNIINAAITARALNMKVIGLTGASGGDLERFANVTVKVPETETYIVQELHLPIYHCWCLMLEDYFFGKTGDRS